MKKQKMTPDHFAFICPMQWEDMQKSPQGRYCDQCQQEVIDVTDCTLEEVAAMQQQDSHLCVAIKTVVTAGVALSMAACAPKPVVTTGAPMPLPVHEKPKPVQGKDKKTSRATCPPGQAGQHSTGKTIRAVLGRPVRISKPSENVSGQK